MQKLSYGAKPTVTAKPKRRPLHSCRGAFRFPKSSSDDAIAQILDYAAGQDPALGNEYGLVQPRVTRITRLESRRGPEVLIRKVPAAVRIGQLSLTLRRHLQEPAVVTIDDCAIVGEKLGAHVAPGKPSSPASNQSPPVNP